MTPKQRKRYVPHLDALRYDILCESCGAVMILGETFEDCGGYDGLTMYRYDCPVCDGHTMSKEKYPVLVPGWKNRNG